MLVQANDFFFSGLHLTGNTSNPAGSKVTPVTVAQLPGLNSLSISMVRIDYAPMGMNPPHTHPRASEILTVLEGSLEVGFVTSNPGNSLFTKVLQKGDVFVFPEGLVHFQRNVGHYNAVAIAALSSQNPGVITISSAVFGSKPDISVDILSKAFQVDINRRRLTVTAAGCCGTILPEITEDFVGGEDGLRRRSLISPLRHQVRRESRETWTTGKEIEYFKMAAQILFLALLVLSCSAFALAADQSPLQDFCVADPNNPANDFFFSGFHLTDNTSNPAGSKVTPVIAAQLLGFNNFSISMVRIDDAPMADHSPLQDFCVADPTSPVLVNGFACKNPMSVQANDFFFSGLHLVGNTSNPVGSRVTPVTVVQLPGLNSFGISMVRIDYAPMGINPPHTHPRATEILTVVEGSLEVGFVTSNPGNNLFSKVLKKGDVFVFPEGLVHFQRNAGHNNAVAIAALSSQNPGVITIANAVFGSKPDISADILSKAFQVDKKIVSQLQSKF
ncbi:hypothetical protein LguiA_014720 [Lonicera macranthoides]